MKQYTFMLLLPLLLGCAKYYLTPVSACRPLSAYDTLIIAPFDGDSAFVEEEKYTHLPRSIANATPDHLKEKVEDTHLFRNVAISPNCADHAVKLDGKIYSLSHHRGFYAGIRGKIIDCKTGESLYKYDKEEQDDDSINLPPQIASKLASGIRAKMACKEDLP
jgi:hypothetical protein